MSGEAKEGETMLEFLKRRWTILVGIAILCIPIILSKDIYWVNVVCSVVATSLFWISVCLDDKWRLKDKYKLKNRNKLERMQGMVFAIVFLVLSMIGYIFKVEAFIPIYMKKNGLSSGLTNLGFSWLAVGVCTLIYKLVTRHTQKGKSEVI